MTTEYIEDKDHYEKVIERIRGTKSMLWIGTADIKDLHIAKGKESEPFLGLLSRGRHSVKISTDMKISQLHSNECFVPASISKSSSLMANGPI